MLNEAARVVAVGQGCAWVEASRKSGCQTCSVQTSCGHRLFGKAMAGHTATHAGLRIPLGDGDPPPRVGDEIALAVPGALILKLSLLFYLLPLAGLLAASVLAGLSGAGEPAAALAGLTGLAGGFLLTSRLGRRMAGRPDFQARARVPLHLTRSEY